MFIFLQELDAELKRFAAEPMEDIIENDDSFNTNRDDSLVL